MLDKTAISTVTRWGRVVVVVDSLKVDVWIKIFPFFNMNTKPLHFISGKQCAPGRTHSRTTCFNASELRAIATAYNRSLTPHRTGGGSSTVRSRTHTDTIVFNDRTSAKSLWTNIHTKMKGVSKCATEKCWSTQFAGTKHLGGTAFRPSMPSAWKANQNEWLSTTDIEVVLKQYEYADQTFHFVGAVPVDFDSPADSGEMGKCVTQTLCNTNIKHWLKKGFRKIGVVFNLDTHHESGSHWVSLFLDLAQNHVLFYDSYGAAPPYEIHTFMEKIASQLEGLNQSPCAIRSNENRHQFKNTECGVYSMYFIASMLDGMSYDTFIENGLTDTQMQRYRYSFYYTLDAHDQRTQDQLRLRNHHRGGGLRLRSRSRKLKHPAHTRHHVLYKSTANSPSEARTLKRVHPRKRHR